MGSLVKVMILFSFFHAAVIPPCITVLGKKAGRHFASVSAN